MRTKICKAISAMEKRSKRKLLTMNMKIIAQKDATPRVYQWMILRT